ncbi:hypothetical protein [Acutalibacter sp. 1XD8-33]|uniref:hypothetical protein n=1 Tax=Acutalibacter sp. 1XD8-33 TaxID=2320081 RepID=UPI001FAAC69B|nr:hypothetical protein [Acutalibacter sp. 1XD8-33]
MELPKRIASVSFDKDSLATILLAKKHGEPLDEAVYCEVMFYKGISGEVPEHRDFIYDTAIPVLERMGIKIIVLRSEKTCVDLFTGRVTRCAKRRTSLMTDVFLLLSGILAGALVLTVLLSLLRAPDFYRMALEAVLIAACAHRLQGAELRMGLFVGIFCEIGVCSIIPLPPICCMSFLQRAQTNYKLSGSWLRSLFPSLLCW